MNIIGSLKNGDGLPPVPQHKIVTILITLLIKDKFYSYNMRQIQARPVSSSVEAPGFKSSEMFKQIQEALDQDGATIVKKMKGVFCFKVKGSDGKTVNWIVDVKNGNGAVKVNSSGLHKPSPRNRPLSTFYPPCLPLHAPAPKSSQTKTCIFSIVVVTTKEDENPS
ncbi:non-specific lipid-transfer protein [Elysia marginata]|uniref:Non-specific lipid-transfer protein n=1 Tax=Elysia marginata TaxID=1093978 RepID=A0AAV4ERJ3_9GAST|nr:non-specific lipid-transfer protein [Elysia marginata]